MIQFRDAVQGDLVHIAPILRPADAEEWRMGSGKVPTRMIEEDGYKLPSGPRDLNRVALDASGTPLILYGVNELDWSPTSGWVWLIAQARAPAFYRQFVPKWDEELEKLKAAGPYDRFVTASWVGNEAHHRWLRAMGFEAYSTPIQYGPYGAYFQPFRMEF